MALHVPRKHPWRDRFPRPRGDGPQAPAPAHHRVAVSPPTRGWPLEVSGHRSRPHGFPAHAGMARLPGGALGAFSWFPRPRGDGPVVARVAGVAGKVSPPTRGWPLMTQPAPRIIRGFPAHAGMAPARGMSPYSATRFPRPRGDGPVWLITAEPTMSVSPPTRGWPHATHADEGLHIGFPAHAGMAR